MAHLPARREEHTPSLDIMMDGREPGSGAASTGEIWGILVRNRWLILLCVLAVTAGTAFFTRRAIPIYQASATLRIEEKESSLPEVFRTIAAKGALETETEILRSRTLAEEATDMVGLRVRVTRPGRVARDSLFASLKVSDSLPERSYQIMRRLDNRFQLVDAADQRHLADVSPGREVRVGGLSFVLSPVALEHEEISFYVSSRAAAALDVESRLSIVQPSKDARVINLQYEDSDPELVWRVPNAVIARYLARRQTALRSEAQAMVEFLRDQISRVAGQMAAAEDTFRVYRERTKVIAPDVEASSHVTRWVAKESERSTVEAERSALARSLEEVRQSAAAHTGGPSPYRKLLGLPFLLRNQAAAQLFGSLASVEDQRAALLVRRTPEDADVQVLDQRIRELESQLFQIASTYLGGLENQVASLDTALLSFDRQLAAIPRRQVEYARLARKAKGLEDVYTVLQTRLKEAEIAEASRDLAVQVVDTAVAPLWPSRPRPAVNMLGGIVSGLLLGLGAAFLRERLDRSIHTRKDVLAATGLPVLGLIPHIENRRGRFALITQQRRTIAKAVGEAGRATARGPSPVQNSPSASAPALRARRYTFLTAGEGDDVTPTPTAATFAPQYASATNGDGNDTGRPATPTEMSPPTLRLMVENPGSAVAEAYGILQTNLAFARPDREVKSLVITSPLSGDGKTTNAINLALTMAERGLRTLLIDADLRRGALHLAMDTVREPGLADVLAGTATLEGALRAVALGDTQTLHFLTAGRSTQIPTPLLESKAMRGLLADLEQRFDLILLDAPPVNIITDAALLGALVDGVLIVARSGTTDAVALSHAVQQLRHVRASILGVLLNDIDFRRDASYDGSYRFYDYSEYHASSVSSS